MVKRIIWSKNALRDKVQILDYWFKRIGTKRYSGKLDRQLRQAVKGLRNFPEMGRLVKGTNIRFLVKDYYQIFYKIYNNEVRILHIWDSRRNPKDLVIEE